MNRHRFRHSLRPPKALLNAVLSVVVLVAVPSCRLAPTPGLVPPTVVDDPTLPAVRITVGGRESLIHVREFGESDKPLLMVAPGSLSDVNPYLPFAAFADAYRVVIWDLRGNGLSERVPPSLLSPALMAEEFHAVKQRFSPEQPVTIVGHSWSADFAALYLGMYPQEVRQAILLEPTGLTAEDMSSVPGILNLTTSGYLDMNWFSDSLSPSTHEALDFRMYALLSSGVREYFVDNTNPPPWPVKRVGGAALIVWENSIVGPGGRLSFDFTRELAKFQGRCLLVGSSHSPIGAEFQESVNARHFTNVEVLRIENSGHRIVTEQWEQLESGLRSFLEEYGG